MSRPSNRDLDIAFGQLMLTLRMNIGLTQSSLANILGVSRHAIGGWETGQSYPKAAHLMHLIALGLQERAFAAGQEAEQIRALWRAAHQKVLLDEAWLHGLLAKQEPAPLARDVGTADAPPPRAVPQVDWGDAPDVPVFYGRAEEMALLTSWVVTERCRVVSVLGLGGIGKSAFTATLMRRVAAAFDVVIWRSLRDAPACDALLDTCLQVLDPQSLRGMAESLEGRLDLLMRQLRDRRVLLVLDNLEVLLEDLSGTGRMRAGFAGYARLLQRVGETAHQSCLLLTSRENPSDLIPLEGSRAPVRALRLAGLDREAGAQLLSGTDVAGTDDDQIELIERYQGNPLALKLVAQAITELFGGDIDPFLAQGELIFGNIRALLGEQFGRLSTLEQHMFFWLAIMREPVSPGELQALLSLPTSPAQVLEALNGLSRRSLTERGPRPGSVTLQSVVLEYATARLIEELGGEIARGQLDRLHIYALCHTQAKEYVRRAQEQLLLAPILGQLRLAYPGQAALEAHMLRLLDGLRGQTHTDQGYAPANLVALLRLLRENLRGLDLSRLALRGLSLQGVELQDTNLSGALIQDGLFTEGFGAIRMVAISRDGQRWAAGSRRGEIWVWGEAGRALHLVWQAHLIDMTALVISSDGERLASAGLDGAVKLWDVERGTLIWTSERTASISTIAFRPDGRFLASGGSDGKVSIWDVRSGIEARAPIELRGGIASLAWSPDGRLLACGRVDGHIELWTPFESTSEAQRLAGHAQAVPGLAFAPDGARLASAGFDGTVKLWDIASGACLQTVSEHSAAVLRVAWSPDGRMLASCSFDHTIWLWDVVSGMQSHAILHGHAGVIYGIAFAPDSRTLLSGSDDGTLRVWDVGRGQVLRSLGGYISTLLAIDWSPDGTRLASGGADALVTIWRQSGVTPPSMLRGHRWIVQGVAWHPDGQLLASGGYDNTVSLWDTATGARLDELHDPAAPNTIFLGAAWSPDGRSLAVGSYVRGVHVWDLATRALRWVGRTGPTLLRRVAWSPDGRRLAGGGGDGVVYLWDVGDGVLRQLLGHDGAVTSVAWSPDGAWLASGGGGRAGGELFVWDAGSGARAQTLGDLPDLVSGLAWSQAGDLLVSGGSDGMLRWWEMPGGRCVLVRQGHQSMIQALTASPDGGTLASCGDDGAIVLWDMRSGAQLQTLRRDRPYERMQIAGLSGISGAQRASLIALGAVERAAERPSQPSLAAPTRNSAPTRIKPPVARRLPFQPTSFIGRAEEIAAITEVLRNPACRLLTLLGPGGIGKTRLATEVAAAQAPLFADGVAFVALAPVDTQRQIVAAIGEALGLSFADHADPTTHLLDYLRGRQTLLVLDNFEHLLDSANLIAELLAHVPQISLIVTSRKRLNLQAEWLFTVDGLSYPLEEPQPSPQRRDKAGFGEYSAVQLFVQRAMQVQPALTADEAALATIARICQHVAGMPLAIELAAAGARMLPLDVIEQQIHTNLDALVTPLRDVPPRHRSLRAVFDHSWRLLDARGRVLLARLAVFRGGCLAAAAIEVAGATLPALFALVDTSLVRQSEPAALELGAGRVLEKAAPRFMLLEPIREYALEQLLALGEAPAAQRAHARHYQALAETAAAQWGSSTFDWVVTQLRREHDNMRAALAWACNSGEVLLGLRLAASLWQFWRSYGFISEGRAWLEQLLALAAHATDPEILALRLQGLHAAAWLASDQHDYAQSTELFAQSTALRQVLGEGEGATDVLLNAARQARAEGDYQRATTLLEQALAWHRARGHGLAGGSLPLTPALNAFGQVLRELGLVAREQGDFARARELFEESLAFHSAVSDRACVALALLGFADVARDQGQGDQVLAYGEEALAILRELGMQWGIGFTLNTLARGNQYQGNLLRALALIRESEALFRGLHADGSLAEVLVTLGSILRALGDRAAAYAAQAEALRLAQALGPRLFVAMSIEGLAVLMADDSRADQAAQLFALAAALRRHMGAPTWPADQAAVNTALATTRSLLGDGPVAKVWAHAHALPLEQLLDAIGVIAGRERHVGSADTSAVPE